MSEGTNSISVSQALAIAKEALESITVKIVGEVSELSINARYKAVYFTIKDDRASLPCMMWNNRYNASGIELRVGSLVEITGRFSLYAAKGRMNFDVFSIELAGEGKLRMQVAAIAKKLKAEGLMASERKLAIPAFPQRIGLVTSPRGAAVYDVMRTIKRRYPLAQIVFAGVGVEGPKAPSEMMGALKMVEDAGVDVILLVRGGGSFEDLMPFNDEGLARFIADMTTPIVTGIGHEPDTTISDMVSDMRASTPTAAAESVVPSGMELLSKLDAASRRLSSSMESILSRARSRFDAIRMRPILEEPVRLFANESQALDDYSRRLSEAIPTQLENTKQKLASIKLLFASRIPQLATSAKAKLMVERRALRSLGAPIIQSKRNEIASCAASMHALSPLAVLERGYSIASTQDGSIVKAVADADIGSKLSVQVSDGHILCTVDDKVEEIVEIGEVDGSF